MYELIDTTEQEYIISSRTLNKLVKLLEDKPFRLVIELLNEIKAVSIEQNKQNLITNNEVKNANY